MKMLEKERIKNDKNNFFLSSKKGISLIVLIVTIIVIIILAGVVILSISNNNPIGSAKEATFKEDVRGMQDELSLYLSKKYTKDLMNFNKEEINLESNKMVEELPSTSKYKNKVKVEKGELVWIGSTDTDEYEWFKELSGGASSVDNNIKNEWKDTIASVKEGVPIPKGFKYKEGTKDTGFVIQDEKENEFVWIPATIETYVKDTSFPGKKVSEKSEDDLPKGIDDETYDVKKYGGFYIGRYEAGVPDSQSTIDGTSSSTSNVTDVPVSKKDSTVWTNINYNNAKASAEKMIENSNYVQTGLLTGKAWDTTCHFIEDSVSSLGTSTTYGNYTIKVTEPSIKQTAGFNEKWKVKNIYDLAGNVWEWTNEIWGSGRIYRGGSYSDRGNEVAVSCRNSNIVNGSFGSVGFRVRLYIK